MSARVIVRLKDGSEKKLYKPLAQLVEKNKEGKIIGDVLTKQESLEERILDLEKREAALEKREKELKKQVSAATRKTK